MVITCLRARVVNHYASVGGHHRSEMLVTARNVCPLHLIGGWVPTVSLLTIGDWMSSNRHISLFQYLRDVRYPHPGVGRKPSNTDITSCYQRKLKKWVFLWWVRINLIYFFCCRFRLLLLPMLAVSAPHCPVTNNYSSNVLAFIDKPSDIYAKLQE